MRRRSHWSLRSRLFLLVGIFGLLGTLYWGGRSLFSRRILLPATQKFLNEFATARVEKIGSVGLDLQGNLTLRQMEVYTDRDGMHRLFYRAPEMVLSVDGIPGLNKNITLTRVELRNPEIFLRRERNGIWNVEWAFQSSKPKSTSEAKAPTKPGGQEEGFPRNGIQIQNGTIHLSIVGKSGREVTWTITQLNALLKKESGKVTLTPCSGAFYEGQLIAYAEVASFNPFSCDFQVRVTGSDVARLADRLTLSRPINGKLDGALAYTRGAQRTESHSIAAGMIEITKGDLWELPIFIGLLSILGLDPSLNRTIDSARLLFTIEEDRVRIDQMNFIGAPLCLFGDGSMDLTGESLNVVFIPRLGKKGMDDIIPVLGTPVQWLLDLIKGIFVPVVMTGSFDKPSVSVKPGYIIAAPVRKLIEDNKKQ